LGKKEEGGKTRQRRVGGSEIEGDHILEGSEYREKVEDTRARKKEGHHKLKAGGEEGRGALKFDDIEKKTE